MPQLELAPFFRPFAVAGGTTDGNASEPCSFVAIYRIEGFARPTQAGLRLLFKP